MATSNTMTIIDILDGVAALRAAGAVAPRTADGFRTAILALQRTLRLGDDTDLAGVDVDMMLDQFRSASPDWWAPNTITTYCNNVRRILTGFNDDGDWVRSRRLPNPRHSADLGHSIELRPGRYVRLRLPADLTAAEAGRVARFIIALPALVDPASAAERNGGTVPAANDE